MVNEETNISQSWMKIIESNFVRNSAIEMRRISAQSDGPTDENLTLKEIMKSHAWRSFQRSVNMTVPVINNDLNDALTGDNTPGGTDLRPTRTIVDQILKESRRAFRGLIKETGGADFRLSQNDIDEFIGELRGLIDDVENAMESSLIRHMSESKLDSDSSKPKAGPALMKMIPGYLLSYLNDDETFGNAVLSCMLQLTGLQFDSVNDVDDESLARFSQTLHDQATRFDNESINGWDDYFQGFESPLRFRCPEGHEWEWDTGEIASYAASQFYPKNPCPACSLNVNATVCYRCDHILHNDPNPHSYRLESRHYENCPLTMLGEHMPIMPIDSRPESLQWETRFYVLSSESEVIGLLDKFKNNDICLTDIFNAAARSGCLIKGLTLNSPAKRSPEIPEREWCEAINIMAISGGETLLDQAFTNVKEAFSQIGFNSFEPLDKLTTLRGRGTRSGMRIEETSTTINDYRELDYYVIKSHDGELLSPFRPSAGATYRRGINKQEVGDLIIVKDETLDPRKVFDSYMIELKLEEAALEKVKEHFDRQHGGSDNES